MYLGGSGFRCQNRGIWKMMNSVIDEKEQDRYIVSEIERLSKRVIPLDFRFSSNSPAYPIPGDREENNWLTPETLIDKYNCRQSV